MGVCKHEWRERQCEKCWAIWLPTGELQEPSDKKETLAAMMGLCGIGRKKAEALYQAGFRREKQV